VVGIRAAHEHGGLAARAAGLNDVQSGHSFQEIRQCLDLPVGDLIGRDDGDAARDLHLRRGNAGGGDHDGLGAVFGCGARNGRACEGDGCGEDKK